jgi:uncharacterized membrane protein YhaH (DUF805 family)
VERQIEATLEAGLALLFSLGVGLVFLYAIASLVIIIPLWRILRRAGFAGALSLLQLIPVLGTLVVLAILAFTPWPAGEAPPQDGAPT